MLNIPEITNIMKWIRYIAAFVLFLIALYFIGPRPHYASLSNTPATTSLSLHEIPAFLADREAATPELKPNNQARIIWADSVRQTPYSIVYLHGFSASEHEGHPVHENIAKRFGCNLYLARLPEHGLTGDSLFKGIEPSVWVEEARQAIAIGKVLGEHVIVMGTSTGATLASYLAAEDPDIASLVFYAPNFDLFDSKSTLLNGPWGRQLARQIFSGSFREWPATDTVKAYWTTRYHLDGLHALRALLDQTMTPAVFEKIQQPLFVSYYYQDEEHQDTAISIEAIKAFLQQVGTPAAQQTVFVTAKAGSHPIASSIWNEHWLEVEEATASFLRQVIDMEEVVALELVPE